MSKGDKELRKQARMRQVLFDHAFDAIVVVEHQGGRIVDWNRAATRLFDYSAEQAIGENMLEFIVPQDYQEEVGRSLADGVATLRGRRMEIKAKHADGSEIPVAISMSTVKLNGDFLFIAAMRDMTSHYVAVEIREKAQREISKLFLAHAAAKSSLVALSLKMCEIVDVQAVIFEFEKKVEGDQWRLVFLSDYILTLTGYTMSECREGWMSFVHARDRKRYEKERAELLESSALSGVSSVRLVRRDGKAIEVDEYRVIARNAEGQPIGMYGLLMERR